MFLDEYRNDTRLPVIQIPLKFQHPLELGAAYLYASDRIAEADWHWLHFHFSQSPPHPVGLEIAWLCAKIEATIPNAGKKLINSIASRRNKVRNEQDYQGILQDFAEILVLDQILTMQWPEKTTFFYEPPGRSGKRPELHVSTPDQNYLFEVKAPSLLNHQRSRQERSLQIPTRGIFPLEHIDEIIENRDTTLPRDNPIKDFLVSGEEKFSDFDLGDGANILVIVWDDFIYEPIGSLINDQSGLLTQGSWFRDEEDQPITFPNIDGVVVIRHLVYFVEALADRPLPDRISAFDFGTDGALPNVFFPTPWGRPILEAVLEGLRAVDYRDEALQRMAEYRAQDMVLWF